MTAAALASSVHDDPAQHSKGGVMTHTKRSGAPPTRPRRPHEARSTAGVPPHAVDDWTRLRRFLVLGADGATYDATRATITREAVTAVERCIRADGPRAVAEIVHVSGA